MGVYIKGMEMPTRCGRCDLRIPAFDDGIFDHYECCITAAVIDNLGEKMDDCPLALVPAHGRLIDADALEKDIDNYIGGEESRSRFHHWVQVQNAVIPGDKGAET